MTPFSIECFVHAFREERLSEGDSVLSEVTRRVSVLLSSFTYELQDYLLSAQMLRPCSSDDVRSLS